MTAQYPPVDPRRQGGLDAELLDRAHAILPEIRPAHPSHEWLRGLLAITARIETEVTRRLDRVPEKVLRNFFDWLGVRGRAARAARLASVFRCTPASPQQPVEPQLVPPRARLQAQTDGGSVVFETQQDLRIFPGGVVALVAVNGDKIFQPPPGLFDPTARPPVAILRRLKSAAPSGSTQLQVTPALGLATDNIVAIGGQQYRITDTKGDLISIDPALAAAATVQTEVNLITAFNPFGNASIATPHDWQEHVLYIGDDDLFNIKGPATITVESTPVLEGATWSYWGKKKDSDPATWIPLIAAPDDDGIALAKGAGAIEQFEVNGQQTRVLRAIGSSGGTLRVGTIKVSVKSQPAGPASASNDNTSTATQSSSVASPNTAAGCTRGVDFEGIANVAPIPSPIDFYPLGLAPRLFDSFYLGCREAFSKQGASATLQFEMASPTLGPLAIAAQGNTTWLFGIGTDGLPYRLHVTPGASSTVPPNVDWKPIKRPSDSLSAAGGSVQTGGRVVSLARGQLPVVIKRNSQISIAAYDNSEVWWLDNVPLDVTTAQWLPLGQVDKSSVTGVVVLQDAELHGFAACGGKLYEQSIGPTPKSWQADGAQNVPDGLQLIAPFRPVDSNDLICSYADGIVATSETGDEPNKQRKTYVRRGPTGNVSWTEITPIGSDVVPGVLPLGIKFATAKYLIVVAVKHGNGQNLVAILDNNGTFTALPALDLGYKVVEPSLSFVPRIDGAMPTIVFVVRKPDGTRSFGLWRPGAWQDAFYIDAPAAGHVLSQGAAIITPAAAANATAPEQLVIPGNDADALAAWLKFDSFQLPQTNLRNCVVAPRFEFTADHVEVDDGTNKKTYRVDGAPIDLANDRGAYRLRAGAAPAAMQCRLFKSVSGPWQASNGSGLTFTLDLADNNSSERTNFITIRRRIYELSGISGTTATLAVGSPSIPAKFKYRYVQLLPQNDPSFVSADLHPLLDASGLSPTLKSQLAGKPSLIVQQADPDLQEVLFFEQARSWAVLTFSWITPPASAQVQFFISTGFDPWQWVPYQSPANPALSWEYWNGTGWWNLELTTDEIDNLRHNGNLEFDVPTDIKPTDVLGRTNHWIRARLVGGDYGQESFSVQTQGSTQTFQRNSDSIHAPHVLCLTISYAIKDAQYPARIVTRDNVAWRDQSAANRDPNAVLELYQLFGDALVESQATRATTPADEVCCEAPPAGAASAPCACQQSQDATAAAEPGSLGAGAQPCAQGAAATPAAATSALFLGTDVQLTNSSVRVLWGVDEQPQGTELVIESLRDGVFEKVLYEDETGGFTETGILTLTFDQSPGLSELFGRALYWLRLSSKDPNATWQPVINRVCLNAAWAEAAETQDMEILGSSDGSPNQIVAVARPPVLDQSLELRVSEPLTDDQVAELRNVDPSVVRDDVPNTPGYWVRWTRVVDPLDAAPGDRVYALDEKTGTITFGDALHGAVPPRGRDNIIALTYKHGGGTAANKVPAGAVLKLISPIAGVQGVVAAVGSAGGADSAAVNETLQHAPAVLWTRERAITSRDLEQLTLAYAPEIVQARCVVDPRRSGAARLIYAVSGQDPRPSRAAREELRRYLLTLAPPGLADTQRFRVDAPGTKSCWIEILLTIDSLDRGGTIEQAATDAIRGLLHWASGGFDGRGWPLGRVPGTDDLAAVLVDISGVLGIGESIALFADAARTVPFPATLSDDTLVMLAPNGVKITLGTEDGA